MKDLINKVAVVTGAASGIGEGIAITAARRGANVVLADIAADRMGRVTQRLKDECGVRALEVPTDVSDPEAVEHLAEAAYAEFGAVHMLFNNAGFSRYGASWDMPMEDWKAVMDTDFYGCLYGIRAFVPRMIAAGEPGHIINTASLAGLVPTPRSAPYAAAKHALVGLSASLRYELEMEQIPIKVTVVCPGYIKTGILQRLGERISTATSDLDRKLIETVTAGCESGMDIEEAGRVILDGVANGQFWISPNGARFEQSIRDLHQNLYEEAF
ncbi:SDR family NAD(P)-dependent oxidoreductase [Novosphingobium pentaromativorans]|nr:SDR family NAD(P)-dependent oxidoreductase [Novosphingobium pentaromativorans]AIT81506.1 hypothetical protein JI59_17880 [Novosphingobium pentaromativorans US6-1]